MFVTNSAPMPVSAVGEGHGKDKPTGTKGSFMSLMSMALAAFFGGGVENLAASQAVEVSGDSAVSSLAVETQAPAGGNTASAETRLSPETIWALIEGGSTPASGQVAGPVDAAYAAETGGQIEGAAERRYVDSGASAVKSDVRSSVYRALAEQAGDVPGEGILTSVAATNEEAVAPAYGDLLAAGPAHTGAALTRIALQGKPGVQAEPVATENVLPLSDEVDAADRSTLPATQQADSPEPDVQVVRSAGSPQHVESLQPTGSSRTEAPSLTAGESSEKDGAVREIAVETAFRAGETETFEDVEPATVEESGTLVLPVEDVAGRAVEAAAEPEATASPADGETPQASDSIRSARKMAETLLRESLKRLPRSVEVRLDPPQLGSVTALLSQRGQEVTVKFIAHSNEAQRALQTATEDLARALSEKGLTLTGFVVDPGYSGEKGREHRQGLQRPSTSRYHRAVRPLAIAGAQVSIRQPAGAFSWLA